MCTTTKGNQTLYWLLQFTWCAPQNLIGLLLHLLIKRNGYFSYKQSAVTYWPLRYSMGMGRYIFITCCYGKPASADHENKLLYRTLQHEYGHCKQSLLLGPCYLPVIALPSLLWCVLPCCRHYRQHKGISYHSFYTERWADKEAGIEKK